MTKNQHKGKGWHGDSAGHARAGRKGGKASSKNKAIQSKLDDLKYQGENIRDIDWMGRDDY